MELLLTPVVNKILSRFIKKLDDGTPGSQLRARLYGGSFVLHNLELNLDSVSDKLPIEVHRAFAKELRLSIVWTALASQPIQVDLLGLEIVIAPSEEKLSSLNSFDEGEQISSEAGPATWLGSITSLLLHTLFDTTFRFSNLVVRAILPSCTAHLACQAIVLKTPQDGWQRGLKRPDNWLKKCLTTTGLSISLESSHQSVSSCEMLKISHVDLTALMPIFAIIEDQHDIGQPLKTETELIVGDIQLNVRQDQVSMMKDLASTISQISKFRRSSAQPLRDRKEENPNFIASIEASKRFGKAAELNDPQKASSSWLSSISNAVGNAWNYITDEAALIDIQAPPPSVPRPRMTVSLAFAFQGGCLALILSSRGEPDQESFQNKHFLAKILCGEISGLLDHNGQEFVGLDISIGQVSMIREVLGSDKLDEVLGLHPCEEIESPALVHKKTGTVCALRAIWQSSKFEESSTNDHISLTVGKFGLAYPVGFLTDLALSCGLKRDSGAAREQKNDRDKPSERPNPVGILFKKPLNFDLAILAFQASVLSAREGSTEAISIAIDRISAHLGIVKPASRPGSVSASLQSLTGKNLISRGLRLAVVGIELGIGSHWQHLGHRKSGGLPLGTKAVCSPIECQILIKILPGIVSKSVEIAQTRSSSWQPLIQSSPFQAFKRSSSMSPSQEFSHSAGVSTHDEFQIAGASSPLNFELSSSEIGAFLAVIKGVNAERAKNLATHLPSRLGEVRKEIITSQSDFKVKFKASSLAFLHGNFEFLGNTESGHFLHELVDPDTKFLAGIAKASLAILLDSNVGIQISLAKSSVRCRPGVKFSTNGLGLGLTNKQEIVPAGSAIPVPQNVEGSFVHEKFHAEQKFRDTSDKELVKVGPVNVILGSSQEIDQHLDSSASQILVQITFQSVISTLSEIDLIELWKVCKVLSQASISKNYLAYPQSFPIQPSRFQVALDVGQIEANLGTTGRKSSGLKTEIQGTSIVLDLQQHGADKLALDQFGQIIEQPESKRTITVVIMDLNSSFGRDFSLRMKPSEGHTSGLEVNLKTMTQRQQPLLRHISVATSHLQISANPEGIKFILTFIHEIQTLHRELCQEQMKKSSATNTQGKRKGFQKLCLQLEMPGLVLSLSSRSSVGVQIGFTLKIGHTAFVFNDGEPVFKGFPAIASGFGSLQDLICNIETPGSSNSRPMVYLLKAHMELRQAEGAIRHSSAKMTMPHVLFILDPLRIVTLQKLISDFKAAASVPVQDAVYNGSQDGQDNFNLAKKGQRSSSPLVAVNGIGELADDLRSGLFEMTHTPGTRPDPLQIGFGDKQPGLLPWRGVGESWICWNYPYPREVSVILISLPAELIHASELELLGYVEEGDSFLDVEIEIQRCKDLTLPAGQENFVLVIVKEDVAYQEWQLCWECPLQHPDFTASHMLHHLYINPDLGLDNVKFDLVPVPLTLGISVVHFELRLNTSSACIEGTIDAGRIRVDNLRVVWHSWKLAHSLRIAGDMSTSYVDVISRTEETLVPQSFLSLCYENKNLSLNSRTDTPQLVHDLDDIRQVKHISQEMENELCFPVLQPCTPGHSISLRGSENPLRLYASELAYHALGQNLRSLRKAMKSAQELVLGIGTSGNPVEPCISFENHSGASLQFFQLGTDTPFELNSGAVRSYIWRSIPNVKGGVRRLLYISGKNEAKCEEQDPSESFQSVRNSQKQSSTDLDAFMNSEKSSANSDAKKLCWNSVLDVMTQGHNLKIAHFWNSMKESLLVAVQVVKEDFGWRVKILPGCKISNKTGLPLTMSIATQNFSGNLSGERIFDTTDSPVLRVMPEENYEAGDQGEYVSVHLKKGKTGIETALSALRIWLGRGNGWSNAIKLYACEPQIQKLSPAGFEGMSPRTPVFKATNLNPGSLISVLTPSPSLLELTIWPAMVIKSDLPVPVFWKLTAPEFSAETFDQDGTKVIQTLANIGHPLQCLRGPQETLAISLSHQASGKPQYTDVWSAEIMTEAALSNSYRWGVLNSSRQSLPAPGQSIDVNVPNNGKFLQLKLAAEPSSQDLPVLHLRLLPFCNAQNCTDLTITISFSNDTTLKLDAMKRGIGDWDSQIQFPRQATLTASRENSNWISPVFDLKAGDLPLDLPEDLTGRSSNGTVKSISTLRLAVNISMQSCKQAGQSVIETLILNISHGVHATNLTNKTLRLVPGVANGRENSPLQVEMGQSATLPWVSIGSKHHRDRDSKESMDALDHRIDRRSTDGLDRRISMSVDIFDPGGSPSRGMTWEYVALHETSSRQRHLLGGNDNILLTCRVLQDKGRLHAVFFEEEQPPFVIQNNTRETIEVGYFLPEANKLGEIQHETPKVVVSVSAEAHCKICLQDHTELGWDGETEDEEAFLERITEQSRLPVPYLGKLRFRTSANDCWSELCPVQCGSYDIGRLKVILHSAGAALHCTLHSKDNHPECLQWNRRFTVEISQIQVSFLDDERLRLLGCAETLARPEKLSQLPQETLALQLNAFQANVNLSTRGEFKCCEVQVSAGSLEIATFLPHASQPYLCASVPLRTSKQKASHAPFQIDMEVFTDNGLRAPQMSFKSSWIQDMKIFLPTLAVTVDDSILAFLDTLSKLYANSRAIKDSGLSQGTLTGATPAQEKQIRQLPFSPAKKPAMLDLSALDNLDISARAITPHCAGSLSSRSQSFDPSFRDLTGQSFREDTQALMIPLDALQASELELYEEALKASANRLYVGRLTLGRISLLLDLHISEGSRFTPLALDTHATPISLPHIHGRSLFFRPSIMLQGLLAHYAAEALLNAPAVLGSLELLLNPTGLLHSMGQGFEDLVGLPMAALETGSPAQFIAGLGLGSASLVRHFSGWTLTSISGFSSAFSKVLRRALSAQGNQSDLSQVRQRAGLVSGIQGLAEGISSGVTGIYRAPVAGYGSGSGSGLAAGVGRGLLGVVGLPISGALELISSLSSGLASSTGIVYTPKPGRKGLLHGSREGELSSIPPVFHMDSRRTECHSLLFLKTLWTEIDCADSVLKGRHQDFRLMLTPHSLTMFDSQGRKLVSLRLEGQKLLSLDSTSDLSRLFLLVGLPEAQTFQLSFELDLSERQVLQESSFSPE